MPCCFTCKLDGPLSHNWWYDCNGSVFWEVTDRVFPNLRVQDNFMLRELEGQPLSDDWYCVLEQMLAEKICLLQTVKKYKLPKLGKTIVL